MLIEIDKIARWLQHDVGCSANDLDYLDKTPCTCGLREIYNPKNQKTTGTTPEYSERPDMSYRDHQAKLRADGWTPYNSDYVDEFPQW